MSQKPPKSRPRTSSGQRHSALANQIRIIGGQWKRTPIPVGDAEGLRPTPARVRETLCNWIDNWCQGNWTAIRALDLFAGSGALGFEAASRGAAQVDLYDSDRRACARMGELQRKLGAEQLTIYCADVFRASLPEARYNLVFVDPPFGHDSVERVLPLCARVLVGGGLLYVEAEFDLAEEADDASGWLVEWQLLRSGKAGQVFYHLLQRRAP